MRAEIKNHFKKFDPALFNVFKIVGDLEETKPISPEYYFSQLCREIIGQQLSGKVAKVFLERFNNLFPEKRIMPKFLSEISDEKLRNIGISWAKVKYLKDLANKVNDKEIVLSILQKLDDRKIVEELTKIKGIGNWTAEMFLMFSLGREDVFSRGDLGLRRAIETIYNIRNPSENTMEKISRKWIPYRTWACRILWKSHDIREFKKIGKIVL